MTNKEECKRIKNKQSPAKKANERIKPTTWQSWKGDFTYGIDVMELKRCDELN